MQKTFFDQPVKNDLTTCDYIPKISTGQADDYTYYNYFKKHYKLIAMDLSKQQALDADPKPIQSINFTVNLKGTVVQQCFSLLKEQKK